MLQFMGTKTVYHYEDLKLKKANDYYQFRRISAVDWEVLMGDSWESVWDFEELEAEHQKRIHAK